MPIGGRLPGIPNGPAVGPRFVASQASGLGFIPTEFASEAKKAVADSDGLAIVQFSAPLDRIWHVQRISVSSTSGAASIASVYLAGIDPANLVDVTPNGNQDIADELNPILIPSGQDLLIVWTGADANSECSVRVQFVAGHLSQLPLNSFGG